jgi:superfamily II DNA/RNA helicase
MRRYLVLDEADQMLEIGFKDEMERIMEAVCKVICIRWRMLTYADVCCRILTEADVC